MLWGRREHKVEISLLAYGRGAGVLPMSSESLVEQGPRAVLAEGLLADSRGSNRCLVMTPGSLLGSHPGMTLLPAASSLLCVPVELPLTGTGPSSWHAEWLFRPLDV